jgi:hypothetical protein
MVPKGNEGRTCSGLGISAGLFSLLFMMVLDLSFDTILLSEGHALTLSLWSAKNHFFVSEVGPQSFC